MDESSFFQNLVGLTTKAQTRLQPFLRSPRRLKTAANAAVVIGVRRQILASYRFSHPHRHGALARLARVLGQMVVSLQRHAVRFAYQATSDRLTVFDRNSAQGCYISRPLGVAKLTE